MAGIRSVSRIFPFRRPPAHSKVPHEHFKRRASHGFNAHDRLPSVGGSGRSCTRGESRARTLSGQGCAPSSIGRRGQSLSRWRAVAFARQSHGGREVFVRGEDLCPARQRAVQRRASSRRAPPAALPRAQAGGGLRSTRVRECGHHLSVSLSDSSGLSRRRQLPACRLPHLQPLRCGHARDFCAAHDV